MSALPGDAFDGVARDAPPPTVVRFGGPGVRVTGEAPDVLDC